MGYNSGFKGLIYYSYSALHVSGEVFDHHQEHLTVFTVSSSILPSGYRLVSWLTSSSNSSKTPSGSNLVNNTRYCKYSQVLLMMDENIARNM